MKKWSIAAAALLAALAGLRCGPGPRDLEAAVTCYVEAVQDQDGARWLGCASPALAEQVLGGPLPSDPGRAAERAAEILRRFDETYLEQRKAGRVDYSAPDGILLTRLLWLGRGAYYATAETESSGGRARLTMDVRLMYRLIDFPRHRRRGETFWRLGRPLGSIYPIISGMTQLGTREELTRVRVEWDLERAPDGPWFVRSARLDPQSTEFSVQGE